MAMTHLYDCGPLLKDLQLAQLRDLLQHPQGLALLARVGEALAAMAGAAVARGFAVYLTARIRNSCEARHRRRFAGKGAFALGELLEDTKSVGR
eukprot:gene8201-3020_t